jgi:succinoglycan biosynthesis transport protein ExoP
MNMSNFDTIMSRLREGAPMINWEYLRMLGERHYRLFLWVCGPVVALTILYLLFTPSQYESTAVVQVEQKQQRSIQPLEKGSTADDLMSEDSVKTIEQNMQSYDLFEAVVKNPDIANDPNFLVGYKGRRDPAPISELADWLEENTKISLRHGTRLIDVTVYHRVPEMAQKLALALVDSYIMLGGQAETSAQQANTKLLSSESSDVKNNLQKSETSLETYKYLLDLKKRIDDQQTVIDQLKERYRDKHPQMIQARELLGQLDESFDKEFQRSMATAPKGEAVALDSATASAPLEERVATELKLVEARSQVLQKEVDTESTLFNNVLAQMRDSDVTQNATTTEIQLVGPPALPAKPSKPKKAAVLLLGLTMGVFLGLGAVVGIRALEGTIDTPMEAESVLGISVLGTILQAPPKKDGDLASAVNPKSKSSLPNDMVVVTDPGGAAAEGFRSLRAVLNLLNKSGPRRTTLFTSALPGEGKTFVSCNYALALAQAGVKTLLIDADLRRPEVHNRFSLINRKGMIEVLTQDVPISQVVYGKVSKNLDIMTAGGPCSNPAELLAGPGFRELLAKALEEYDHVVVDTSPVNLVSDCLLMAPEVDSVCFVVRAGSTSRQAPKYALSQLRHAQKEPAGVILNAILPGSDRLYLGYKGSKGVGSYGKVYS